MASFKAVPRFSRQNRPFPALLAILRHGVVALVVAPAPPSRVLVVELETGASPVLLQATLERGCGGASLEARPEEVLRGGDQLVPGGGAPAADFKQATWPFTKGAATQIQSSTVRVKVSAR